MKETDTMQNTHEEQKQETSPNNIKEKIAIITDVNAGLDQVPEEKTKDIFVLRSALIFGNEKPYIDGIDITIEQFYNKLRKYPDIPKTAAPSMGDHYDLLNKLVAEEYTHVIILPISNQLSKIGSTFVSIWENEYKDKIKVVEVDTLAATYFQGFYAIYAKKMVEEGKPFDDIIKELLRVRETAWAYFIVNDLRYLVKNGRLSAPAGMIASLFRIKPILSFTKDDGRIVSIDRVRTHSAATQRTVDLLDEKIKEYKKIKIVVVHSDRLEEAKNLVELFNKKYQDKLYEKIEIHVVTPAVACHVGCGLLGMGFYAFE
jgi:DegV family protein with EDD domain